ncbi:hypothetical protein V5O48_016529 [Marasmius crinis-equi]|uniref:DEAD/DEAH-box helicase domain-containing protein n=1 Tax=Marasmius crinis-equi TaxID=585013 RepID=A0ABR3ERG7_9AGAR
MAPLFMPQARAELGIVFVIVPTEALTEQHSATAARYGLNTFALTEDTVRDVELQGRDLFKEIWTETGIHVAVMSPRMLSSTYITLYIQRLVHKKQVKWVFIDEVHLLDDSSGTFQHPYQSIESARARLLSQTVWAAATGSLTPTWALAVARNLGFQPGHYINADVELGISTGYPMGLLVAPYPGVPSRIQGVGVRGSPHMKA